ncbi:TAXI family TRAP transporter solute-binding subunit [Blastococcus saxobsidens]|uniref:Putative TRAP transporter solute receptor, TAXI family n=1 Tax=Blastococcus saxobsidens (strain DD2) TaxID=1146883 RepID=H6RUS4_BLASD|nr:TAXI family TRAP transporter solute-binding subunit [Blastococcus saxobsidens]CCG04446.1 putative TRAP transporter solute receptor, TAXI family [Blastococcus saxobsidens DD2]
MSTTLGTYPGKRSRLLLSLGVASTLVLTACGGDDAEEPAADGGGEAAQEFDEQLTFATGGTGGVYYPYGGGMANLLSSEIPGLTVTVQETNASVDNMQLLDTNQAQMALALGDVVSDAANGENTFSEALEICSLGNTYNNFVHFFTTADTGITSIEDLAGKRVSPGAVGSASEVTADRIMEAAGIDPQADIERVQLGVAETVAAIQDGTVDAGAWSGGLPTGAIVDLASTSDLVLIPTGEYAEPLAEEYGDFYFAEDIPAGTYEGQEEAVPNVVSPNILVVRTDMDEALQEAITRTIFENEEQLLTVHPAAEELNAETADEVEFIETCPGAQAYFDSVG